MSYLDCAQRDAFSQPLSIVSFQIGFIRGIYPALDDQITIGTVKNVDLDNVKKEGIFKKIFGGPGNRKKE